MTDMVAGLNNFLIILWIWLIKKNHETRILETINLFWDYFTWLKQMSWNKLVKFL